MDKPLVLSFLIGVQETMAVKRAHVRVRLQTIPQATQPCSHPGLTVWGRAPLATGKEEAGWQRAWCGTDARFAGFAGTYLLVGQFVRSFWSQVKLKLSWEKN